MKSFEEIFKSDNSTRGKFLSRLFGIFSEEIVRCWATNCKAPYENLGRPTVKKKTAPKDKRGYTLDFTFRCRDTGKIYVSEMKCELQYRNYKFLRLENPDQLHHHKKPAFHSFLDLADVQSREQYNVTVQKKSCDNIDGTILVWGSYTDAGHDSVIQEYGFSDILSVENIIQNLIEWNDPNYQEFIGNYQAWCSELFTGISTD